MTPVELVLSKLPDAKNRGRYWSARCPAHEDRHPSLSVREGNEGRALVKCHAGCTAEAIVEALGLTLRDLMPPPEWQPPRSGPRPRSKPTARPAGKTFRSAEDAVTELTRSFGPTSRTWPYHDADGSVVGMIVRWDRAGGKDIRPVSNHPGGWRIAAMPEPQPLYGLPDLAAADVVIVTEGEKAADAARSLGFVASTSAGGSGAAGKTDWSPLAGKKVVVLPDNDDPGRKYADAVAGILGRLTPAPEVKVVELPGLPDHGDIVDWIAAHGDAAEPETMRAEVEALAAGVEPLAVEPAAAAPPPGGADGFRPFPVEALPEPARRFVAAAAKAIGCDPSYLALPLLVVLGAAVGTTRRLELKRGWLVPSVLWGVVVGESGTAKSPGFKRVTDLVHSRQRRAFARHAEAMKGYEAELARWEKKIAEWKKRKGECSDPPAKPDQPQPERLVVCDTTVEALAPILEANPRGVLLARDELAGWFGSFDKYAGKGATGTDSANWLSLFNVGDILVDRKTAGRPPIQVPDAAVWVVGSIQPGTLRRALGAEHRESGLAARLLMTCPPRVKKRWTEDDIDPSAVEEMGLLLGRLYGLQPAPGDDGRPVPMTLHLTPEAKTLWVEYFNAHANEQVSLSGDLSAAWSKLEEYAARLALVVHLTRGAADDPTLTDGDAVDAESMRAGIALATWFKHEAQRVYALLDESDAERDNRELVEWIRRKQGTVTVREVQQGYRKLKAPGAGEAALEALVKAGRGVWHDRPADGTGGRPTRVFVLNG